MTVPFPLPLRAELHVGGAWVDITGDVRTGDDVSISRGRKDEASTSDHGKCSLTLNNRHGRYSPRNPASPYYGRLGRNTPIRVGVDLDGGTLWRFAGEVAEWPARWDTSGSDVWVPIEAAGVMRRLGQGSGSLHDAARRFVEANGPFTYWPLTDGEDARQGNPAIGSNAMRPTSQIGHLFADQPDWGRGELAPWLISTVQTRRARGRITGAPPRLSEPGWTADWIRSGLGAQDALFIAQTGDATNTSPIHTWFLQWESDIALVSVAVQTFDDTGVSTTTLDSRTIPTLFGPDPHHYRLTVVPDGSGGSDWEVSIDGTSTWSGNRSETAGPIWTIGYDIFVPDESGDDAGTSALGHVAAWRAADAPEASRARDAVRGHRRELAGRRIERICVEEGVALTIVGDPDDTPLVGPQYPESLLDTLRTAADVDGGVLLESRDEAGLLYRTGRSRYNQGR